MIDIGTWVDFKKINIGVCYSDKVFWDNDNVTQSAE